MEDSRMGQGFGMVLQLEEHHFAEVSALFGL